MARVQRRGRGVVVEIWEMARLGRRRSRRAEKEKGNACGIHVNFITTIAAAGLAILCKTAFQECCCMMDRAEDFFVRRPSSDFFCKRFLLLRLQVPILAIVIGWACWSKFEHLQM